MTDHTPDCPSWAGAFRVGDWLVEPSLDRLSKNGTAIHLRPQLTNLLVFLARNPGRTVSKDEILSKVWEGQFVAESGMTRCIAELRQALEDDARNPHIVQTITKRGYRLVAPVVMIEPECPRPPADAETCDVPVPSTDPDPQPVVPHLDAVTSQPNDGMVGIARRRWGLSMPAARLTAISVVAAAALSTAGLMTWGWPGAGGLSEHNTAMLADVVNTTGDSAFDHAIRLALGVHLAQAPFLKILPASEMRTGLQMMGRSPDQPVTGPVALELCRRAGAAVLLAGSVAKVGTHFAIGLEALACSTGDSVARELVEVNSKDDVLSAFGTAAGRVRRTLGESRESLRRYAVPIARATTSSLEALKAMSLGDTARDRGRLEEALALYREATTLDPLFALAWARSGAAAHNVAQAEGDERAGVSDEVTLAFKKAYDLRERVAEFERFYIQGHYYRFVSGEIDEALENYSLWKRIYPGSGVVPNNVASLHVNALGQYDAAIPHAREAVKLTPSSTTVHNTLLAACLGANRVADAKQAFGAAERAGAVSLSTRRMAFDLAFFESDAVGMQEQVRLASRAPAGFVSIMERQAAAAASKGRWREARRTWADAGRAAAAMGDSAKQAWLLLRQAETEALAGDQGIARRAAASALSLDHEETTVLGVALALALAEDPVGAARLLREAPGDVSGSAPLSQVWQPVALAAAAAAGGRRDEALETLARTARFERGRNFGLVPLGLRGMILLSVGRPQEAAVAFRDVLALRALFPSSPWVGFARLGLARALRATGDIPGSLSAFDALIRWMEDGDPDAPLLVTARRERAALPAAR